ncbi:MAG: alpha/beta fold hydrolase [Anaerolineae bacterium]
MNAELTSAAPSRSNRAHAIRRTNRALRRLLYLIAPLVFVVAAAWSYDAYALARIAAVYPAPGQFVQVGNSRMHYICQGTGEPTLVLVAGIPGGALDWMPVMPLLSQHHRVCAFDRLGQDWSDPAPQPRTFSTAADELHAALQELGIVRPVVIGHSFGGALVQVYAAKYDVAGVVLVDGFTTGVIDQTAKLLGGNRTWDPLARLGLMRPVISVLDRHEVFPPALRAEMSALRSSSTAWLRTSDEEAVAAQTMPSELRAAEPRLDMPLLIIAAGKSNVMNLGVGAFASASKELTDRKPNATFLLFANAKHYIQAEQPQALAAAIESWLDAQK